MISKAILGTPRTRVEAPSKVTGGALYETDVRLPGMAYAALVTAATIGRIAEMRLASARASDGVLDILSFETCGEAIRLVAHVMAGGYANSTWRPLASPDIAYPGQIVALVVAESLEAVLAGAALVEVAVEPKPGTFGMTDAREHLTALRPGFDDPRTGDFSSGLAAARAVVDAEYRTPVQHHNPMELFGTLCAWDGDHLTVHESARFVTGLQHGLAAQLGIPPDGIRVLSRLVGGHFGSRLGLSQHTALVALAARRLGRPVKLVPSRRDGFTIANHRPETRHHVRIAADADGRLTALSLDVTVATSRFDDFAMPGNAVSAALYACPNITTTERVARVDRNTPGPMRAPPEVPYLFALECALDELSHALGIDPIALRRRNDTRTDPVSGKRYTTRPLMRCFDQAAAAFGWQPGPHRPRSRREGDWRLGSGCASAVRPVKIGPAAIRLTLTRDGSVIVATAQHEIGNGLTTILAMAAADALGIELGRVSVRLGDSDLPPGGLSGGSSSTTSLVNALDEASATLRRRLAVAATCSNGALAGADPSALIFEDGMIRAPSSLAEPIVEAIARLGAAPLSVTVDHLPDGFRPEDVDKLRSGKFQLGQVAGARLASAFGAQFAEVRVHARTGEIRVSRLVGAFAAGRILNPLAARSQLTGAMIWGIGSALLEETIVDPATGRYVNADLADYLVPTMADVPAMEAHIVEDHDAEVNPAGVKGLGEIGIIGVNAAIANAVYAATGRRVRSLPIRIADML